jgi:hypothetical protein
VALRYGIPRPSREAPAHGGATPAGFEWAPLSTIPIDTVDSSGSAVALDEIVPPSTGDGPALAATPHEPSKTDSLASWLSAAALRLRWGGRRVLAAGLVLAAVTVCVWSLDTISRYARWLKSTGNRELVALFTPVVTRLVPGASADGLPQPSYQDVVLASPSESTAPVARPKPGPKPLPVSSREAPPAARPVVMGRLNVNAIPWAEVWVDGQPIGQTPIGNIPISVGSHRLTFRHPDFGELQTVAIVTADETAYATMHFTTSD